MCLNWHLNQKRKEKKKRKTAKPSSQKHLIVRSREYKSEKTEILIIIIKNNFMRKLVCLYETKTERPSLWQYKEIILRTIVNSLLIH